MSKGKMVILLKYVMNWNPAWFPDKCKSVFLSFYCLLKIAKLHLFLITLYLQSSTASGRAIPTFHQHKWEDNAAQCGLLPHLCIIQSTANWLHLITTQAVEKQVIFSLFRHQSSQSCWFRHSSVFMRLSCLCSDKLFLFCDTEIKSNSFVKT